MVFRTFDLNGNPSTFERLSVGRFAHVRAGVALYRVDDEEMTVTVVVGAT